MLPKGVREQGRESWVRRCYVHTPDKKRDAPLLPFARSFALTEGRRRGSKRRENGERKKRSDWSTQVHIISVLPRRRTRRESNLATGREWLARSLGRGGKSGLGHAGSRVVEERGERKGAKRVGTRVGEGREFRSSFDGGTDGPGWRVA